jgi:SAM-dependent methyltransferase
MNDRNEWEDDVYAQGRQINRWPFTEVVSDMTKITRGQHKGSLRVLDLGCGTGNNLWFLCDAGFQVSGIDISPSAVAAARGSLAARGFAEVDLRIGDSRSLPFEDGQFDVVLDRGVLTCLPPEGVAEALAEIRRVLKPGGWVLSYYLFGMENSDRLYGQAKGPRTFENFTEGRFFGHPPVTFFDFEWIQELWARFEVAALERHHITRQGTSFLEERFHVKARKAGD